MKIKPLENWKASDWKTIRTTMERSIKIDKATFEDAAYNAAEIFFEDMSCKNASEAYQKIKIKMADLA